MTEECFAGRTIMLTSEKKFNLIGVACLITATDFLICYRHSYMLYMTNDDASIQNLLNGFTTGVKDPAHQFISIFLGYPLTCLYKLIPAVQWWFVYSQLMMLIGIFW